MRVLSQLKVGESGKVKRILGEGALRRRLLDMGITPNTVLCLIHKAPFGDPLVISLRGYELTLRKTEAASVLLE